MTVETWAVPSDRAREMRDLSWAASEQADAATYAERANARYWEATARVLDERDTETPDPEREAQVREWQEAYLGDDTERADELCGQLWPSAPTLDDSTPYVGSSAEPDAEEVEP